VWEECDREFVASGDLTMDGNCLILLIDADTKVARRLGAGGRGEDGLVHAAACPVVPCRHTQLTVACLPTHTIRHTRPQVPEHCMWDVVGEFLACPQVAYTQHYTTPFDNQNRNYW
jgi:hypothetical protein